MQVRRAVRRALASLHPQDLAGTHAPAARLALVGLSGGADSLALAAALAAEAGAAGWRAGALVVDHALQERSAATAERAAEQARALGLDPVVVRRVAVRPGSGPEAAAREARYAAFEDVAAELGAAAILAAHTRDDQAEQVLLALARGSGTRSIAGIPPIRTLPGGCVLLRPLLAADAGVTRATTVAACAELGLAPWSDPHNADPTYARVRVRERVLPALARELGPGVTAGLARSADLAREDAEALDAWAGCAVAELAGLAGLAARGVDRGAARPGAAAESADATAPANAAAPAETTEPTETAAPGETRAPAPYVLGEQGIAVLAALPAAVRQRVIHRIARDEFGASLSREHTLAIAALVTHWHGQGPAFVAGIRATRSREELRLERQLGSPRS